MRICFKEDVESYDEMHDINVTPFIDVMLVLLIIFMVAAPLATVDIQVDLPNAVATKRQRPDKPLYLSVNGDKQLFVGKQAVDMATLTQTLDQQTQCNKDTPVFFQAEKTVDYATLMAVMDNLRKAGYLKVGLVGLESVG